MSLVYDEAFPIIKRKVRQSKCKPWISKGIRNSIKTKHKLYKKYVNKPTKSNETHYKKYKNKLTIIIRLSHKSHYQNELNKNRSNLKNAWQILREIIGDQSSLIIANSSWTVIRHKINSYEMMLFFTFRPKHPNLSGANNLRFLRLLS